MTTTTHTPEHIDDDQAERNRALVRAVFEKMGAGDVDGVGELLHEQFVSHNPRVPHDPATTTGRQAFLAFLRSPAGQQLMAADFQIKRLIADDDQVWAHMHLGYGDAAGAAAVDILRIQDGFVAEHWDVVQPVPDDPAHPHGMF